MKDSKGAPDCDGSELDSETISLHDDKLSTQQLSLSIFNGLLVNGTAASQGPDNKEVPSNILLHWPLKNLKQEPATDEEVTNWRLESNGFPFVLSDSSEPYADSSCDSSVSEQSSVTSSPCMSLAACSDTRSEDLDNRTDIWVSSFDLDEEDSALLPADKEQQFLDIFSSDFPSPSFRAMRSCLQLGPCSTTSPAGKSQREEASSNYDDDPIFWPFDRTSYDSPEFDRFLTVSPRRNYNTLGITCGQARQLNPVQHRLQKNTVSSAMQSTKLHTGSIDLASKGAKASHDKIKKSATVPSCRPAKAPASSSNHQPLRNREKKRPPHLETGASSRKVSSSPELQADQALQEAKAGNVRSLVEKKSEIEESIGLDEFDGREGINSNSNDYQFSLWLSPK